MNEQNPFEKILKNFIEKSLFCLKLDFDKQKSYLVKFFFLKPQKTRFMNREKDGIVFLFKNMNDNMFYYFFTASQNLISQFYQFKPVPGDIFEIKRERVLVDENKKIFRTTYVVNKIGTEKISIEEAEKAKQIIKLKFRAENLNDFQL